MKHQFYYTWTDKYVTVGTERKIILKAKCLLCVLQSCKPIPALQHPRNTLFIWNQRTNISNQHFSDCGAIKTPSKSLLTPFPLKTITCGSYLYRTAIKVIIVHLNYKSNTIELHILQVFPPTVSIYFTASAQKV
jgi:hypothetical protein